MSQIIFNSVKQLFLISLFILFPETYTFCQTSDETSDSFKKITPLKNNTYDIKEFTSDSLLIYKGILSSINPDVRQGKFYFYDNKGKIIVTGLYKQDIPYGTWVYYNESFEPIKAINYSAVWDYLETGALDYKIDSTILKSLKKKDKETMNPDGTFYLVEKMPSFNGGIPVLEFNKYINENLINPIYAARNGIGGQVEVQFIIDCEGKVRNPVITNPIISDLKIEALRLLSESPIWKPGYQNNLPINVKYSWSISFPQWDTYSFDFPLLKVEAIPESEDDEVFFIVEDMPTLNGRDPATEFQKFILKNLRYPEGAAENCKSGLVIVQFIINPNGKVVNAVVVQSADPMLDQEALRVIRSSPPWTPGKQKGKPVNVMYTFPINFVLQ
jgi:TonB family protein